MCTISHMSATWLATLILLYLFFLMTFAADRSGDKVKVARVHLSNTYLSNLTRSKLYILLFSLGRYPSVRVLEDVSQQSKNLGEWKDSWCVGLRTPIKTKKKKIACVEDYIKASYRMVIKECDLFCCFVTFICKWSAISKIRHSSGFCPSSSWQLYCLWTFSLYVRKMTVAMPTRYTDMGFVTGVWMP
jgi:hypothetical protein